MLNKTGGHRLLILDGHNSHTTYRFCSFAEKHKIIILCLPPHTTHRLQPCDVGVFGPLAACWKAVVNANSREYIPIRKNNLIQHYAAAREKAFSRSTIQAAFRKSGIWPLNPDVLPAEAFAPALNTTIKPALPIAPEVPALLVPIEAQAHEPANPNTISQGTQSTPTPTNPPDMTVGPVRFKLANYPPRCLAGVPRDALMNENERLRVLLADAQYQMERDYALKVLMNEENGRLRERLFNKSKKKPKTIVNSLPRHLTSEDALYELAKNDWLQAMKDVWKEPAFRERKKMIEQQAREEERRKDEKKKAAEKEEKKRARERQKAVKDAEVAERKAMAARLRAEAAATRKATTKTKPAGQKGVTRRTKGRARANIESDEESDDYESETSTNEETDAAHHHMDLHSQPKCNPAVQQRQQSNMDATEQEDASQTGHTAAFEDNAADLIQPRRSKRIGGDKTRRIWQDLREQDLI